MHEFDHININSAITNTTVEGLKTYHVIKQQFTLYISSPFTLHLIFIGIELLEVV